MAEFVTIQNFYHPEFLTTPVHAAFGPAVIACAAAMQAVHTKTVRMTIPVNDSAQGYALIRGGGLASVWEKGRQPGYPIYPAAVAGLRRSYSAKHSIGVVSWKGPKRGSEGGSGSGAIKFPGDASGGMAAYATGGAMAARPFMMEIASRFEADFYNPLATAMLASSGMGMVGKMFG